MDRQALDKKKYIIGGCVLIIILLAAVYKIGELNGREHKTLQSEEPVQQTVTPAASEEPEVTPSEEITETSSKFILGTSKDQEEIDDEEAYDLIKNTCLYTESMRDEDGNKYQISIYSPNNEIQKVEDNTAFGSEGEKIIEGPIYIAIKGEDNQYFREYKIEDENITLNLSRELIRVEKNRFSDQMDFLIVGKIETSNDTFIRVYKIAEDKIVPMTFARYSDKADGSDTAGTNHPFFFQSDEKVYEVAYYDNYQTFKYYVEQFNVSEASDLFDGFNAYAMEIEEFNQYAKAARTGEAVKPAETAKPVASPKQDAVAEEMPQSNTQASFNGNWIITDSYQTNGDVKAPLFMEGGKVSFDTANSKVSVAVNNTMIQRNFTGNINYRVDGERTTDIFTDNPYGGHGFVYDTVSDEVIWFCNWDEANNSYGVAILNRDK